MSNDVEPPDPDTHKKMFGGEILKIIKSAPNKSCEVVPIRTSLVRDCISVFLTPITNIVIYTVQEDKFPPCLKTAGHTFAEESWS